MSVITIFNGLFCGQEAVVDEIVQSTGHRLITDDVIVEEASALSGIDKAKIQKAFSSKSSVFNQFTHEKECSIAYLKLAVAQMLEHENILNVGYASLLVPRNISHILRVCMIANMAFRIDVAKNEKDVSPDDAAQIISLDDGHRSKWTQTLFSIKDPWDKSLYDMVLPMEKTNPEKVSALIKENLLKDALRRSQESQTAVMDFLLEAKVSVCLANAGHNVGVQSKNGGIRLIINKKVLMLNRLEDELKTLVQDISGVESIETCVEQEDQQAHVYRKHSLESPSKVLLVDDEREFVQTLSERLQMRDMGCVVAFDGESALELVRNDDPEVMILDLKMPGIDGMEVLNQVKKIRPEIEVIVLTGHGSEQDQQTCMDMGAFAYMQKPIDINILSTLLNDAHKKIKTSVVQ